MNAPSTKSRFAGCLIGGAAGDALGMPTEKMPRTEIIRIYGGKVTSFHGSPPGRTFNVLKPGQYTDDTQQAIALAESLDKNKGFNLQDFAFRIGQWGLVERGGGRASLEASRKIREGIRAPECASPSAPGCAPAMRVAPTGLFYKKFNDAFQTAGESSLVTHAHEVPVEGAKLVAGIINLIVHSDLSPIEAAKYVESYLKTEPMRKSLRLAVQHAFAEPEEAQAIMGAGFTTHETVGFAIYSVLHSPKDYEQTVICGANVDNGDSDSIASIAGAISGAYNGLMQIPSRFFSVEDFDYIKGLAYRLFDASEKSQ